MSEKIYKRDQVMEGNNEEIENEITVEEVSVEEEYQGAVPRPHTSRVAKWEKIGRFCLFASAFLAPIFFLPFAQNPVETNKIFIIGALTLVSLISFLVCTIEKRTIKYPKEMLSIAILIFLGISAISAYFSIAPLVSLYGYLREADSLLSVAICSVAFFLSFYFLRKEDAKKLGSLIVGSFTLATLFGILQISGIFIAPWSFTASSAFNPIGSVFAWGICMAVIIASIVTTDFHTMPRGTRGVLIMVMALMGLSLILLNYQFLWLALTVITIIVASVRFVSREHFRLPLVMVVVALFLGLMGARFPSFAKLPIEVRPGIMGTLASGMHVLKGLHIITGTGPSTFNLDFVSSRPVGLNQTSFWDVPFFQGYSYATTLLATEGILGVLAFLFVLFAAARHLIDRSENQYASMLLTGTIFLFAALFFYPAFFAELFLIFLGLGLIVPERARREVSIEGDSRWKAFSIFIVILIAIAFSLTTLYRLGQKYIAAIKYDQATALFSAGKSGEGFSTLQSVISLDGESDEYLRGASQALIGQAGRIVQAGNTESVAQAQTSITSAIQAAQGAIAISPQDSNNLANLGSVYEAIIPIANGADTLALAWYSRAQAIDPSNPQIPFLMARTAIAAGDRAAQDPTQPASNRQKDYALAEEMLHKSLNLKPDYVPANLLLAQLYIKEGNLGLAIQTIEGIKANNPLDSGLAFQLGLLYYQNNQMDNAQQELERAVRLSPDYSNARYFLGLVYDQKGMKAQALDQFEKILALNPDNAGVRTIIANLQAGKSALRGVTSSSTSLQGGTSTSTTEKIKK